MVESECVDVLLVIVMSVVCDVWNGVEVIVCIEVVFG